MSEEQKKWEVAVRLFALSLILTFFLPAVTVCEKVRYPFLEMAHYWSMHLSFMGFLEGFVFMASPLVALILFLKPKLLTRLEALLWLSVLWYGYWIVFALKDSLWGLWFSFISSATLAGMARSLSRKNARAKRGI